VRPRVKFYNDKISWASNGSRVISKDISWRLKKIAEISQRQRLYRVDSDTQLQSAVHVKDQNSVMRSA